MAANIATIDRLKMALNAESVQQQFKNALKENSGLFVASLIDICSSDKNLQQCEPKLVIAEALKAATLKLPINKSLGFAYIVPFKHKGVPIPTFIPGYKGYIQLAMRTGMYRFLNADVVYEGEFKSRNKLTGEIDLSGEATSENIVGYFCYMEMLNGFKKTLYWTREKVLAHAKKYSKSFNNDTSAWQTNFDDMALKTVVRNLLTKYGYLSVEMLNVADHDLKSEQRENEVESEIAMNANDQIIDIDETTEAAATQQDQQPEGPGF